MVGGMIGNMLFGGHGYATPGMTGGGGGIGLFDIILLGALLYFGLKFYKRWRQQREATAYYGDVVTNRVESPYAAPQVGSSYGPEAFQSMDTPNDVDRGLDQIRQFDPNFGEDAFKELVQDMFFRIQAGWMNRSLDGIEKLLTGEMSAFFKEEFDRLKQQGRINRLENIAVRKVEMSEAWQEEGKDYVTVLFTANLLDYVVDDRSGEVVEGDRLNPTKFQEFWTFCRDVGTGNWQLCAINQPGEPSKRH
jgi:predicted lipid-binding transport protein (Tim44 family)